MAAYAALVSLTNLIQRIHLYHDHHPTFLDEHQTQLQSLHQRVTNLQDLLEWCSNTKGCNEAHAFESQLAEAAHGAEDIIELYIVRHIRGQSLTEDMLTDPNFFVNIYSVDPIVFSEELHKVIGDMDHMGKRMVEIKEKKSIDIEDMKLLDLLPTGSIESSPGENNDTVVFTDEFKRIMNTVMGHERGLQIISLTGMGGIGKSTLARNVHDNKSTVNNFDVRAWIIISQQFNAKRRIFDMLKDIQVLGGDYEEEKYEYHQLGRILYQHLYGRRFLIIVDDVWNVKDWEKLKLFLPDDSNGSRIILTTRLSNVAKEVGSCDIYGMNFLDEDTSWNLLCRKVFLNEVCPPKLEEIGKKIAKNCKGLPLSLSVIGGLLAKLNKTRECWENIAGDISNIVSSEDDERYLKILALSYNHLPIHLKPCFVYMGLFPEDHSLEVDTLFGLWLAEGFLKPCGSCKSLEEVAKSYLEDLIERSLLYVSLRGLTGNIESIRIHDLLRDLALREARKENFLGITAFRDPNFSICMNSERRVGLHGPKSSYREYKSECENVLSTATFLRSLICDAPMILPLPRSMRLLRISKDGCIVYSPEAMFDLVNARHLHLLIFQSVELSSVQLLWNLQIVILKRLENMFDSPFEHWLTYFPIWEMPLLRKLYMIGVSLPDLPKTEIDLKGERVLTNLQSLSGIHDFRCTDAVLMKIPDIKELVLMYSDESQKGVSYYLLNNLAHFYKLQDLAISFINNMDWPSRTDLLQNIEFSKSLKYLILGRCGFEWELLTKKVGSLPLLEELSLYTCYTGEEWDSDEGFFPSLKILRLRECPNLVRWSIGYNPFPHLEHLLIWEIERLEEIPLEIADTATLQSIQLVDCSNPIVASAKIIIKEQRSAGNDGLRILVNNKHLHVEEEEGEEDDVEEGGEEDDVEEEGEEEEKREGEQDDQEEKRNVDQEREQEDKRKKRGRRFMAVVVPLLAILGLSYVLHTNKFGGRRRGGGGKSKDKQKENDDKRRVEDSWWLFYEYP